MFKKTGKSKSVLGMVTLLLISLVLIEIVSAAGVGIKGSTENEESVILYNAGTSSSAADVGYILKYKSKVNKDVISVFNELGLSYELIEDSKVLSYDLSKYKFIFLDDSRFTNAKKIPIYNYPSVIMNGYHGVEWGLTDNDGLSQLSADQPLNVRLASDGLKQVYTKAEVNGKYLYYYYLDDKNCKLNNFQTVARTWTGNIISNDIGDVISVAPAGTVLMNGKTSKGDLCFYGISKTEYWTENARELFKECIGYVSSKCSKDEQCPSDEKSELYCKNDNVYQDLTDFFCKNPRSSSSECNSNIISELNETCSYGCENGECLPECSEDSVIKNCGADYYSDNYCEENKVYRDLHDFSCKNEECSEEIIKEVVEECKNLCENGECKNITCSTDSDCNDNNIYTYDECNNQGTADSYCSHDLVNCVTNNDCGITGFVGKEFCSTDDVYKLFQNSTCINPGLKTSHCDVLIEQTLVKDCGNSYCNDYGENYCKNNDVYHSRTCYEKGCLEGVCFSTNNEEESLVEECKHGCRNGICSGECSINSDCGNEGYSENYCLDNKVVRDHLTPKCTNSECSIQNTTETIEVCSNGCEDGKCLDKKMHDVALINFTGSINGIKIQDSDGKVLDVGDDLKCNNQYKIYVELKNKGNFTENITFNGNIDGLILNHNPKDNLVPGDTTLKYKTININLTSGTYYVNVNAVINFDNNPLDNIAKREIKVTCSICVDNDKDGYDDCSPGDDGDDGELKDCDDNNANFHPNALEICNGVDDDCDGIVDEGCECINTDTKKCGSSDIGECEYGLQTCLNGQWGECVGNIEPIEEICDLKDNDCDGCVDENNGNCLPGEMCVNGECKKIKCSFNSECGTDSYIGELFCKANGIYQNYQTFKCQNPGAINSYCSNSVIEELTKECSENQICSNVKCEEIECTEDSDCDDNYALTIDKCNYPRTSDSYCTNEPINCKKNSDCGRDGWTGDLFCSSGNVFQNFIAYKCNNPGTSDSYCSHNTNSKLVEECESEQVCANGECKGIICDSDSDCDDNNLYTHDECNNPGTANSYCSHDFVNCVTNNDCGPTGFIGWEICAQDDVVKYFQNSTCNNPGTMQSYCEISITEKLIKDCGEDYCGNFGANYCKNNDVYHSKTCYEKGCLEGACFSGNSFVQEELVEECEYGCNNGMCTGECSKNSDCGVDSWIGDLFCNLGDVYQNYQTFKCNNPGTTNNYCGNAITAKLKTDCMNGQICSNGMCIDNGCDESKNILNNIYTVVNSANPNDISTDRYSLNQARTKVYCNTGDELLSGAGTAPLCDQFGRDSMCGKITYHEYNNLISSGNKKGWMSLFDAGAVDPYYDTIITEAICLKNNTNFAKYFSIYTRTSGSFSDKYSLNQNNILAYCDIGDKVIGGAGSAPACDSPANPACGKNQIIVYNGAIANGNQEAWKTAYSVGGGNDDTIQTIAICLKKTSLFDDYLKVYTVTNEGSNAKNQDKRISMCNAGDIAIAGGGNLCTSPECNNINYFEGNYKIDGNPQGWYTAFDLKAEDPIFDTQISSVTCLGLKKTNEGGMC